MGYGNIDRIDHYFISSSHLVAHFNGWPADVSPLSVIIAVAFSAAVGIFFG